MRSLTLARLAVRALDRESGLPGKPGLVCPGHSGSHPDMDYGLFLKSSQALFGCFAECAKAGTEFAQRENRTNSSGEMPLSGLLPRLRAIGIEGERKMYEATGGINTHKGAVFSMGLLVAAAGYFFESDRGRRASRFDRVLDRIPVGDALCLVTGEICAGLASRELGTCRGISGGSAAMDKIATNGIRLHALYGTRGARGQAEDGYPLVRYSLLPILRSARRERSISSVTLLDALLSSVAELDDTCLLARGGLSGLEFAQRRARFILEEGGSGTEKGAVLLERLDAEFCATGLSPGGSADLLAAAIFLDALERKIAARRASRPTGAITSNNNGAQRVHFAVAESEGEYA